MAVVYYLREEAGVAILFCASEGFILVFITAAPFGNLKKIILTLFLAA